MKILVADDDAKLNKLVCTALREAGHSADAAFTIADARTKIAETSFDLALIDWMFDGEEETGVELIQSISERNDIPILMLTGRSALVDRVSGLRAGADDYLIKPFYLPELLARVDVLLRRPRRILKQKIRVGALVLDPSSFELKIAGEKISLRKKEFQLLFALVESANETLSRASLGRMIWGSESVIVSNSIDVHIKSLRDRLNESGKMIETIRGIGYRFNRDLKSEK